MRLKNQRLSSEDLDLIRNLTDQGKSLNYLSKIMNLGKPTIYYQVRKFKPRIKKDFIVNLNDFHIGELIGAFAGDGSYSHRIYDSSFPKRGSHYKIRYHLTLAKEIEYGKHIISLLKSFNLNPFTIEREGTLTITVNSKEYIEFIKKFLIWDKNKTLTIKLREDIQFSDEFLRGFARGLMDTDGYVEISNVSCACVSKELINNLINIFDKFGLKYKLSEKHRINKNILFLVRVYRKSLERYNELIGFSNSHKISSLTNLLNKSHSKS